MAVIMSKNIKDILHAKRVVMEKHTNSLLPDISVIKRITVFPHGFYCKMRINILFRYPSRLLNYQVYLSIL